MRSDGSVEWCDVMVNPSVDRFEVEGGAIGRTVVPFSIKILCRQFLRSNGLPFPPSSLQDQARQGSTHDCATSSESFCFR